MIGMLNMEPKDEYDIWKSQNYRSSNYDQLSVAYDYPLKHLKLKPKSSITLSEGKVYLIINHMNGLQKQEFDIEKDVTIHNHTFTDLYCAVEDSLISDEDVDFSITVKNGEKENEFF
tara:strand:+ start:2006 stop:2356 length:351 start_codon:yes stop_codon:yes gene_type:complete